MSQQIPPSPTVRPLSFQHWWLTLSFIVMNVGLFLSQVLTGVDAQHPATLDALAWGADFAPLTYSTEAWRLFSSMFFHFGLIHLMLNMWALYLFGHLAEQHFGRFYFAGLYLLAGLMGSLVSGAVDLYHSLQLMQQLPQVNVELLPRVSAGASGAVMGIGAALTIMSLLPPLAHQRFMFDKRSLVLIMAINLIFGFVVPGINNAAHMGGMGMGAFLALTWYVIQRFTHIKQHRLWQAMILLLVLMGCVWLFDMMKTVALPLQPLWQLLIEGLSLD